MRQFVLLSCFAFALATPSFSSPLSFIIEGSGNQGYEGGRVNTLLSFDVQAVDTNGVSYTSSVPGLAWQVTVRDLQGGAPFDPNSSVLDLGNGKYTIVYTLSTAGTWRLMVKGSTTGVFGQNINGGAALIIETTNEPATAASTASGPGVTGGARGEDQSISFTIQARAADGTLLTTGGDSFQVHAFTGKNKKRHETTPVATVVDNLDGTYTASYWIEKHGDYEVQVTINGQNIVGSPFNVRWKNVPGN